MRVLVNRDPPTSVSRPRRVAVIGNTGAGKSTLARMLARRLGVPHIELDGLYHMENWTPAPDVRFRAAVAGATAGYGWVTDGNYGQARDIIWRRAELVVWLDYSLPRVLARIFVRTLRRCLSREVLWNGNRERWTNFVRRDSLFVWAVQTHGRRRREYLDCFRQPDFRHLTVVRLRTPRETAAWLARFGR